MDPCTSSAGPEACARVRPGRPQRVPRVRRRRHERRAAEPSAAVAEAPLRARPSVAPAPRGRGPWYGADRGGRSRAVGRGFTGTSTSRARRGGYRPGKARWPQPVGSARFGYGRAAHLSPALLLLGLQVAAVAEQDESGRLADGDVPVDAPPAGGDVGGGAAGEAANTVPPLLTTTAPVAIWAMGVPCCVAKWSFSTSTRRRATWLRRAAA
jgi:hypothetical protein